MAQFRYKSLVDGTPFVEHNITLKDENNNACGMMSYVRINTVVSSDYVDAFLMDIFRSGYPKTIDNIQNKVKHEDVKVEMVNSMASVSVAIVWQLPEINLGWMKTANKPMIEIPFIAFNYNQYFTKEHWQAYPTREYANIEDILRKINEDVSLYTDFYEL